jgi:hypothetical protein
MAHPTQLLASLLCLARIKLSENARNVPSGSGSKPSISEVAHVVEISPDQAAAFKPAKWLDPVMERPKLGHARLPPVGGGDPHQVHARRRGESSTKQKRHPEKFAAIDQ